MKSINLSLHYTVIISTGFFIKLYFISSDNLKDTTIKIKMELIYDSICKLLI